MSMSRRCRSRRPVGSSSIRPRSGCCPQARRSRSGLIYQLVYDAQVNPPVSGIGFAATRDLVSFLRYDGGGQSTCHRGPLADHARARPRDRRKAARPLPARFRLSRVQRGRRQSQDFRRHQSACLDRAFVSQPALRAAQPHVGHRPRLSALIPTPPSRSLTRSRPIRSPAGVTAFSRALQRS